MTEPRTWTLIGRGLGLLAVAQGSGFEGSTEVVEKAPVDAEIARLLNVIKVRNGDVDTWMDETRKLGAERERMLSLIANLLAMQFGAGSLEECDCTVGDARDLLREHGRLPKEENDEPGL